MAGRAPALRRTAAGGGMMGHRLVRYQLKFALMGLCPSPASFVDFQDAVGFPIGAVGDQDLARLLGIGLRPQHQDAYRMLDLGDANGLSEIPLGVASHG